MVHCLWTAKNADKILVLVDGEVTEEGTHQELLDKDSMDDWCANDVAVEVGASAKDECKVSELGEQRPHLSDGLSGQMKLRADRL